MKEDYIQYNICKRVWEKKDRSWTRQRVKTIRLRERLDVRFRGGERDAGSG